MIRSLLGSFEDINSGIKLYQLWVTLAKEDVGDQHRRTTLGPLWLLLNYLAFAGSFIFLVQASSSQYNYPSFVAIGMLVWFYIMDVIISSVSLFLREESFIKGTTLPLTVYVMRLFVQSLIRGGYALLGCLIILSLSGVAFSLAWLWSILGIAVILILTPAVIIVFAFLGAFFPDSQFLVTNLMRVGMFLTPVFWTYVESDRYRSFFYHWNPFTYYLEIVRLPIVSSAVPEKAFLIAAIIGLCLWIVALLLLGRLRRQVVFAL